MNMHVNAIDLSDTHHAATSTLVESQRSQIENLKAQVFEQQGELIRKDRQVLQLQNELEGCNANEVSAKVAALETQLRTEKEKCMQTELRLEGHLAAMERYSLLLQHASQSLHPDEREMKLIHSLHVAIYHHVDLIQLEAGLKGPEGTPG